jgi:hypothetical protein
MPNLDLTRGELRVLRKFIDFHGDDTPDEYYSVDDYNSLKKKVLNIQPTTRAVSVVLIHDTANESHDGRWASVSNLIADNEHDMETLKNIARGLNEMRYGKDCVNIGSGGSTGDQWMTYYA